ncbi:serine protease inhibitor 42Dd-like [Musca autumnalis]|uniref:serine protease inhibitor 42Dd-like n=1 Tax=Musca autumnalis TaxID=221902 RepID=UPI003CE7524D
MVSLVIRTALFIGILSCVLHYIAAETIAPSAKASRNLFAANLFSVVAPEHLSTNVVYSPASIQTCLALGFAGADGETAEEMRKVLYLGEGDKRQVVQNYGEFLGELFKTPKANGPILKMANRLYVNENLKIAEEYNKITTEYLDAKAENVDFRNSQEAINKINTWVEEQTEKKIENLMQPGSVDGGTSAMLVNAIYFKTKWLKSFIDFATRKQEFKMDNKHKVQVDMMYQDAEFQYGELPEYEAKVLEMPYENSDLSMMIILPNDVEGLAKLEERLKGVDLNEISSKLRTNDADVFLPKFHIEFDFDLKEPLQKMGLNSMFSNSANFNYLFSNAGAPQRVSDVKHKAFLDVNEDGSEAAAASYVKLLFNSDFRNPDQKTFKADHPFVFAIRSKTAVYFAGHVTKF